jgi:hydrogenase nickel incorporation protein HypB
MAMIHNIQAAESEVPETEVGASLFDANDRAADENRERFRRHGIKAVDFMGAIGSGKTTLVSSLTVRLGRHLRVAVINGDPSTADDILPIARQGVPVVQVAANACHLDAELVAKALDKLELGEVDFLFVENVGNLICPAEFPLGSRGRVVVISVTEGPWMVRKHPHMFLGADMVVINKLDLAAVMGVDVSALVADVHTLKPGLPVFTTSCRTGSGLDELADRLAAL